ncbi:MAG TPA: sigma-54-dependent Fis family transcriptional regulator, partial [Planctomycetaceae bacterium]|nr:sigma-54-dependent Fis family transcriptional regulator [Planctomycetaceae bacterium]
NRDLEKSIEAGEFRQDLYYRLNVISVELPPLRERKTDIPALARHFLDRFRMEEGVRVRDISGEAMDLLCRYDWPGNVRQLRNIVESMVVVDYDEKLDLDDLPEELIPTAEQVGADPATGLPNGSLGIDALVGKTLEEVELMFINATLAATGGNREEAAKMLGIGERTLYRKIK